MPINLQAPLDAVNAAREAYERQAAELAEWMAATSGTDQMTDEALALQTAKLDKAEKQYRDLQSAYDKLLEANKPSDLGKLFVSSTSTAEGDETPKVMKRSEWNALDSRKQAEFITAGGTLED